MSVLGLGVDASTQSLTLIALDATSAEIVARETVRFDEELPDWGTQGGQLARSDERLGEAPPLLWVDALDLALERLGRQVDLGLVGAVAVAGQQHGSVYLNESAYDVFRSLDAAHPASQQLRGALSRAVAPLWTDSRTGIECAEIREQLGGAEQAARRTGSDLYERFTGPQIRWFAKNDPESWEATAHVTLVSSFLTGLLAGRIGPLDAGDAAGTNLMDLRGRRWADDAVQATAPDLARRLPPLAEPEREVGKLSTYFCERYGFAPRCTVGLGTGDNPAAALGAGLRQPGQALLSLGTSDTVSVLGEDLPPIEHGHLFVSPTGGRDVTMPVTGGNVKLQWKPDFGMRWAALGVDYEMYGKEHATNMQIYSKICRILGGQAPEQYGFELFLDAEGQKISKSKGNGISMDDWLAYAGPESLQYFMFQKPRTAKRLHFDVIPKAVDEYHQQLRAYAGQDGKARMANPVFHIHGHNVPGSDMEVSFAMLLNLASAAGAETKDVLWGFIRKYADAAPRHASWPRRGCGLGRAVLSGAGEAP